MNLDFDFNALKNENFKEDSVREFIIAPLLQNMGFQSKGAAIEKSKETNIEDSIIQKNTESQDIKTQHSKEDFKANTSNTKYTDTQSHAHKLEMELSKTTKAKIIIGSNKKIEANLIPDYTLYVDSKPHCVLDAKAPNINIDKDSDSEKQALSYAVQIKTPYYALCNGLKFILFKTDEQNPLCELDLPYELDSKKRDSNKEDSKDVNIQDSTLALLRQYLTTPLESLKQILGTKHTKPKKSEEWYLNRPLPQAISNPQKQAKARYFGCTAYFTRQSWDIVTKNILNFTDEGDIVLDSFGGSGVTAIEAMMNNRIGIHTDLNPLSIFMTKALCAECDLGELDSLGEKIIAEFENLKPHNEKEARQILKNAAYYPNAIDKEFGEIANASEQEKILWLPKDEILPKGSDVESVLGLFSKRQLAELAILRTLIFKYTTPSGSKEHRIRNKNLRYSLLLAFYNTLTMCNLTFHETPRGGGVSGIYAYYRYRIAPDPAKHKIAEIFQGKIKRIIKGKKELRDCVGDYFYSAYFHPTQNVIKDFKGAMIAQRGDLKKLDARENKTNGDKIFQADATHLAEIESESIDFIYTDPPYGAKIPYLDLSTMWNVWLDLPVDSSLREKECIEKGSLEKSRYDYYDLMKKSLQEMHRVLKFNRWLAFVFQHQDPKLWQTLVDSAENVGFEYVGSVQQDNGQASFKKVQNPTRVLKGQIIIYFKKVDNAKVRAKLAVGMDIMERMFQDIEEIIVENNGASLEEIWNSLVIKSMNHNYLDLIAGKFETFIPAINERFELDIHQKYHLRVNASFTNYAIPLEKRIEYLVKAALGRAKEAKKGVSFDELVLSIIPLSKNGVQANNKMIKEILQDIAYYEDDKTGEWHLKTNERTLF
ncbi:hypothetical protein CQA53_06980 [Helicobacter didelphidarum]|uniref:DNA methylase N-4/N-6 domain-containing protein n=1 Tax=Helicobacter didelphidarum TaxID=2040648 RepID=A0A3D8IIL4_9HELI|nr:DNA methyltransferase [Helicobacter didelphidarum]RDU64978.1 hypothetical protein CQA53_06980 [Helicobacter didelphidarum]